MSALTAVRRWSIASISGILAVSSSVPVKAQCELDSFQPSDAARYDYFGSSVAMSGGFAIVGAPGSRDYGREFIPAYVLRRVGWTWIHDAALVPEAVSPWSHLGGSVAIDGDVLVVGAPNDGHSEPYENDGYGAAYVYRFIGGAGWIEEAKLTASDAVPWNFFGSSVAVRGDVILVGAKAHPRADGNRKGSVYVFVREGAAWVERSALTPSETEGVVGFGEWVSFDGVQAVMGVPGYGCVGLPPNDCKGAAYVFRLDGGDWNEDAKITVEDIAPYALFGMAVAIRGDLLVVGAPGDDEVGNDSGAAYVFRRETDAWVQEARLIGSDTQAGDWFATAVSIDSEMIAIGCDSADRGLAPAYVFRRSASDWVEVAKLGAESDHRRASGVALSGDYLAVGAGSWEGAAYLYQILGGPDCNSNTVNDACEPDCDQNDVPDDCDLASGARDDCNGNGIPDDCDADCDVNGVPDDCDLVAGTSEDCNHNEIPDGCDVAEHSSQDCNTNRIPDECESGGAHYLSVQMPDLIGGYAGILGRTHSSDFDSGSEFLTVRAAWLQLTVSAYVPSFVIISGWLDGGFGAGAYGVYQDTEVCVPLPVGASVLDGTGEVCVSMEFYECCDLAGGVSAATLWFEGVRMSASLAGFAAFQDCFSSQAGGVSFGCMDFDYDGDNDIDLNDYATLCVGEYVP